jgi:hypothetical protein
MLEEYLVWLSVIIVGWVIFHYWAFYLILLWSIYFFTVRLLERIQLGDLQTKAVLISGCDSGTYTSIEFNKFSDFLGFGHDLALKCVENGMPVFAGCLTEPGIKGIKEEAKRIRNGEKLLHTIQVKIT